MSPIFPQELCDMVIDFLHDDKPALTACSTVCKNWLPSCRFHLYSDIRLPFIYPNQSHRSTWPLIDAISGPQSSGIRPFVRQLTIDGRNLEATSTNKVLERLRDFDALKRLDLIIINWPYVQMNRRATENLWDLPRANSLKCLKLSHVLFKTFAEMIQFITSAPALETLSLFVVSWDDYRKLRYNPGQLNEAMNCVSPPQFLMALEIDSPFPIPLLQWFLLQSPRRIQTLSVSSITEDNAEAVCTFIHELGSTLEKLLLMCAPSGSYLPRDGIMAVGKPQKILVEKLDLKKNHSLLKISLGPIYLFGNANPRTSDWVVNILSQLSSNLEKVTLVIHMNKPEEMGEFDLRAIRNLFMGGSNYLASTKLHFLIRGGINRSAACRVLVHDLSALKKSNRLQCSVEVRSLWAFRLP